MRIPESCAACLYDKQANKINDTEYLRRVRALLDNRGENDSAPYMVYLFTGIYKEMFGELASYAEVKKQYNDFVLSLESTIREKISSSENPLLEAFRFARVGNFIDFGAMNRVDENRFIGLLSSAGLSESDLQTFASFTEQCGKAKKFLLIADNCGEIVLDMLFLEQLINRFPKLTVSIMVRGGEVLNDATKADAEYVGIDKLGEIVSNGSSIGGTVYEMLSEDIKHCINTADVILAKGQGNYETLNGNGIHIFYSFLCKCETFTDRFNVPLFTGLFIEEKIS